MPPKSTAPADSGASKDGGEAASATGSARPASASASASTSTGPSAAGARPRASLTMPPGRSRAGAPAGAGTPSGAGSGVSMGNMRPPTGRSTPSGGPGRSGTPTLSGSGTASGASSARASHAASGSTGSSASASGSGGRMVFKPSIPVRRARPSPLPSDGGDASSSRGTPELPRSLSARGSGRGFGNMRGGAGRGRGRGGFQHEVIPLHASGPFSMGPGGPPRGSSSSSASRGFSGASYSGPSASGSGDASASRTFKPDPHRFRDAKQDLDLAEREDLSDDDGGDGDENTRAVHRGGRMVAEDLAREDPYAPRALPKYRFAKAKKDDKGKEKAKAEDAEAAPKVKKEPTEDADGDMPMDALAPAPRDPSHSASPAPGEQDANGKTADALDLSESEDEELPDDLFDYFVANAEQGSDPEGRLYLFQFPHPFPGFVRPPRAADDADSEEVMRDDDDDDDAASSKGKRSSLGGSRSSGSTSGILKKKGSKGVVFASDTAGGGGAAGVTPSPRSTPGVDHASPEGSSSKGKAGVKKEEVGEDGKPVRKGPPEGRIGSLNLYRDGRVSFHLGRPAAARRASARAAAAEARADGKEPPRSRDNLVILDVTGGSPATFLQQLMVLNSKTKTATCLGEIERKFVVTPDLDQVLADLSKKGL